MPDSTQAAARKVVLLDRDGTVIVDPPDLRVDSMAKIALFPDTLEALRYLAEHGFAAVFVTNQAGIAEGRLTTEQFWQIQQEVLRQLAPSGLPILKTYMNGEADGPQASAWRKPGPQMVLQAAADLNFSLADSYLIGDSQSDILAAMRAGCRGGILVQTANVPVVSADAVYTAPHLLDAAHYVVAQSVGE